MNMRKIIAVLASALLLCAAIPMGALSVAAAPGDVALDANFDNGTDGFQCDGGIPTSNEGGYLTFNATCADWANAYAYVNGIKADTLYKVTFSAKADKDCVLQFKINNGWSGTLLKHDVDVTTEWTDYEFEINTAGLTEGAIVTLQSGYVAADGAIYNIDNLKIVETVDPALIGKVVNGDFSTNEGWSLGSSATIADGVLKLENVGAWSEAALQTVPVKANTNYEITWKSQCVSGSGVTYLTLMDAAFGNLKTTSGQIWMTDTSGNWINHTVTLNTGDSEVIIFKLTSEDGNAKVINIDDIKLTEIKEPSFDGYITNGDFETGKILPWDNLWGSNNVELVAGHNGDYAMKIVAGGAWTHVRQTGIAVEPNTDYVIKLSIKDAANYALLIKDGADTTNVAQTGLNAGSEWTSVVFEFNSGNNSSILVSFMSNNPNDTVTVDDVKMYKKVPASNDGYIVNGTFETGELAPWNNLWGSCPKAEIVEGGKDDNFALEIVSGLWKHVRQLPIAVEPNTDYKITVWAKNSSGMTLLVKGLQDDQNTETSDIKNVGLDAGDEWAQFTNEFNSGDHNYVIVSFMGNNDNCYGIFDNIVMEKIVCEHEYDDCLDADCNLCGETREPGHNLTYFEAVVAANCQETSHDEYWYCDKCGCYFGDAEASWQHNPAWLFTPGECVRPEGAADCAIVPCEVCGEDVYGYGEHDVVVCQGGTCSKCNAEIEGVGCQNFDTPACEDGVCYYCGGFVAGFGHENGAWAPCLEGECAYGCGLKYPATEDHVDADADDYCDTCSNHLACIDEDGDNHCDICWEVMPHDCIDEDADGFCDICWSEMPAVEIVYGDANGDSDINNMDVALLQQYIAGYDVTLNEAAADANGDGDVNNMDVALLQQFIAGYDVTLGNG